MSLKINTNQYKASQVERDRVPNVELEELSSIDLYTVKINSYITTRNMFGIPRNSTNKCKDDLPCQIYGLPFFKIF